MNKAISNRKLYPALAGAVLVALAAGVTLKLVHTSSQTDSVAEVQDEPAQSETVTLEPLTPFESGPFLKASPSFRLADPALLRSTSPNARVDTVAAGRPDPFAPIVRPSAAPPRPQPAPVAAAAPSQVSPVQTLPVVPVASTQMLPPLPALPTPAGTSTMPQSIPEVAIAPTVAPVVQNPVDQVAITGVAQIGDTVSVIVRESGNASSRHVKPGDLVAGGQVRIKSIDTSAAEPMVVLTYNGQDYIRTVGSSALIGSL